MPAFRLALAGFIATAVAFGPARIGFGAFLPIFREDFALSTIGAGWIASSGFMGFLLALPLAAWIASRVGQRAPVIAGASLAAAGFAIITSASNAAWLATGITLAGSSAGFCWTPFNDAAERVVPSTVRAGTLSAVATGTTFGVMIAGGLALAVSAGYLSWRSAWGVFVLIALLAAVLALIGLPSGRAESSPKSVTSQSLLHPGTLPIYFTALIFGATNAVYLSFATDRVAAADGLPDLVGGAGSSIIFLCYGFFGALGLATSVIEARIGLSSLIAGIFTAFTASLVLIALVPGSLPGVIVSAGLHGAAVMMISSVLSFWTLRLFPGRGSVGFTAALIAAAAGNVLGPATAGPLIETVGPQPAFLILAVPAFGAAIAFIIRTLMSRS